VAPALHSLIIRGRKDAVRIVGILFDRHVDIRKLVMARCKLGKNSTGLLTKIVARFPDLEALSLYDCHTLKSAAYSLIPRLRKLSELDLSFCKVHYVYVKLLVGVGRDVLNCSVWGEIYLTVQWVGKVY
jgi:hypothetical protein